MAKGEAESLVPFAATDGIDATALVSFGREVSFKCCKGSGGVGLDGIVN